MPGTELYTFTLPMSSVSQMKKVWCGEVKEIAWNGSLSEAELDMSWGGETGLEVEKNMPRGRLNSGTLSPTDTGRLLSSLASVSLSVKWDDSDNDTISTP